MNRMHDDELDDELEHDALLCDCSACENRREAARSREPWPFWVLTCLLAVCLAGCSDGGRGEDDMDTRMWGDSKLVGPVTAAGVGTGVTTTTSQITRIQYDRPQTWGWVWRVDIIEAVPANSAATSSLVVVLDATVGIGRASTKIRLGRFNFSWAAGPVPIEPSSFASKWATSVNGPNPDDTIVIAPATAPLQNVIDYFVGQDVQIEVSSQFFATAGETIKYRATAMFAPKSNTQWNPVEPEVAYVEPYRGHR
jgi:hypothetical protein